MKHKPKVMTMAYSKALKYMDLGWTLDRIKPSTLPGINKDYEECTLCWEKESAPIYPPDELE